MRRLIGITFLALALLQLGLRGLERVRAEVPLWDFASVYAAARTWVDHGNPYDLPAVVATWHRCGLFLGHDVSYFATVYPPNSICVMVPIALLPAGAAMITWLFLTLTLLGLQFLALADLAGLRWRDPLALILVTASLASAPFQFGLLSGQLSLPAASACIIALWCVSRDRRKLAGLLVGIACALKPQIAAPFVAYFLLRRCWSVSGIALATSAAIFAVALLAMRFSRFEWFAGWTHSIAVTERIGGVNDYSWAGSFRDEIMDLKMLLVSVIHHRALLRLTLGSISGLLSVWYLRVFRWGVLSDRDRLLMVAGLCAISFLPIYHRVYDAVLLTTALAWALAELDGPRRGYARMLLVSMALFLIPFDFTATAARHSHLIATMVETGWWQTLLAPHYAWGLFSLTIAILRTMSRLRWAGEESAGRDISRSAMTVASTFPAEQRLPTLQGS